VAGYVAILLGRSRSTDDIDIIVEASSGSEIASRLAGCGFKPLTLSGSIEEEFRIASIRFHKPPKFLPNFEVKPPRTVYQRYALENRVEVRIRGETFYISPIELQIAYKLWLGSEKDLVDAAYLNYFAKARGFLNEQLLEVWARAMGISLESLRRRGGGI